ncbi:hypothetical protein BC629DRAFT_1144817 [Irpex lacteus]|nr:hypothetical protein BC629DRAFT_1144817 [Irpex lacteus]
MILPSRLPRRKSSTPSPETDGAGTIPATEDVALPAFQFQDDVQLNAKDTAAALDEMELQYPLDEVDDRPPIYVFTGHGWREPTRAQEALAMTIPFGDPEDPPRVQFGMGLRDCNGQISPYVRTENDDVCVAPSELMQVDTSALVEAGAGAGNRGVQTNPSLLDPKTPVKRKSTKRTKSPPPPLSGPGTPSRKRKATSSSSPSKTRERRKSVNIASTSNLSSIAESPDEPQASTSTSHTTKSHTTMANSHAYLADSDADDDDDEDDQATLVGSPFKRPALSNSPPRKTRPPISSFSSKGSIRPPSSSGSVRPPSSTGKGKGNGKASSPLKPKAATTFAGYQCQMPGCTFTASSPQHIKHHYESFQHGRVTRGASRWEG